MSDTDSTDCLTMRRISEIADEYLLTKMHSHSRSLHGFEQALDNQLTHQ